MKKFLWEILVPVYSNEGGEYPVYYHNIWDDYVKSLSKGLTIMKTSKGIWISSDGNEFIDKMIPVRIFCSKRNIKKIRKFTKKHYEQKKVMVYKISNDIIIK